MTLIKNLLITIALLVTTVASAVLTAEIYRRLRYPEVPRHEADVYYDIGLVFLVALVVIGSAILAIVFHFRKRGARKNE